MGDERKCGTCSKVIDERSLVIGETHYHPECFVCVTCKKPINGSFFPQGAGFSCIPCGSEKCKGCGKDIVGSRLAAGGFDFHPECFKCSECKKPISGKYSKYKDQIMCMPCRDRCQSQDEERSKAARLAMLKEAEEKQKLEREQKEAQEKAEREAREKEERERQEKEAIATNTGKAKVTIRFGANKKPSAVELIQKEPQAPSLSATHQQEVQALLKTFTKLSIALGKPATETHDRPFGDVREDILRSVTKLTGVIDNLIPAVVAVNGDTIVEQLKALTDELQNTVQLHKQLSTVEDTPPTLVDQLYKALQKVLELVPQMQTSGASTADELSRSATGAKAALASAVEALKEHQIDVAKARWPSVISQLQRYADDIDIEYEEIKDIKEAGNLPVHDPEKLDFHLREILRVLSECLTVLGKLPNPKFEEQRDSLRTEALHMCHELASTIMPVVYSEVFLVAKGSAIVDARNRLVLGAKKIANALVEFSKYSWRACRGQLSKTGDEEDEGSVILGMIKASLGIMVDTASGIKEGRSQMFRSPAHSRSGSFIGLGGGDSPSGHRRSPSGTPTGSQIGRASVHTESLLGSVPRPASSTPTGSYLDRRATFHNPISSNTSSPNTSSTNLDSSAPEAKKDTEPNPLVETKKGMTPSQILAEEKRKREEEKQKREELRRLREAGGSSSALAKTPSSSTPSGSSTLLAVPEKRDTKKEPETRASTELPTAELQKKLQEESDRRALEEQRAEEERSQREEEERRLAEEEEALRREEELLLQEELRLKEELERKQKKADTKEKAEAEKKAAEEKAEAEAGAEKKRKEEKEKAEAEEKKAKEAESEAEAEAERKLKEEKEKAETERQKAEAQAEEERKQAQAEEERKKAEEERQQAEEKKRQEQSAALKETSASFLHDATAAAAEGEDVESRREALKRVLTWAAQLQTLLDAN